MNHPMDHQTDYPIYHLTNWRTNEQRWEVAYNNSLAKLSRTGNFPLHITFKQTRIAIIFNFQYILCCRLKLLKRETPNNSPGCQAFKYPRQLQVSTYLRKRHKLCTSSVKRLTTIIPQYTADFYYQNMKRPRTAFYHISKTSYQTTDKLTEWPFSGPQEQAFVVRVWASPLMSSPYVPT